MNKLNQILEIHKESIKQIRQNLDERYFDRTQLLDDIRKIETQISQVIQAYEQQQHNEKIQQKMRRSKFITHEQKQAIRVQPKYVAQNMINNQQKLQQQINLRKSKSFQQNRQKLENMIEANSQLQFIFKINKMKLFQKVNKFTNIPKLQTTQPLQFNHLPYSLTQNFNISCFHLKQSQQVKHLYYNCSNLPINICQTNTSTKYKYTDIHGNVYNTTQSQKLQVLKPTIIHIKHKVYSDHYNQFISDLITEKIIFVFETNWLGIIGRCDIDLQQWIGYFEKNTKNKIFLCIKKLQQNMSQQSYLNRYCETGTLLFTLQAELFINIKPIPPAYIELMKLNLQKFYSKDLQKTSKIISKSPERGRSRSPINKKLMIKQLMDNINPIKQNNLSKGIVQLSKKPPIKLKIYNNNAILLRTNNYLIDDDQIVIEKQINISKKCIKFVDENLVIWAQLKQKQIIPIKSKQSNYRLNRNNLINRESKTAQQQNQNGGIQNQRSGRLIFRIRQQIYQIKICENPNISKLQLDESKIMLKNMKPEQYSTLNLLIKFNQFVWLKPNPNIKILKNPIQQTCTFNCIMPYFLKSQLIEMISFQNQYPIDIQIYPAFLFQIRRNQNGCMVYFIIPQISQFIGLHKITITLSIKQKKDYQIQGKNLKPINQLTQIHYFTCILQKCVPEITIQLIVDQKGIYDMDMSSVIKRGGKYIIRSTQQDILSIVTIYLDQSHRRRQNQQERSSKNIGKLQIMVQLKTQIYYQKYITIIVDDIEKNLSNPISLKLRNKNI